jgi:hypothetical protein
VSRFSAHALGSWDKKIVTVYLTQGVLSIIKDVYEENCLLGFVFVKRGKNHVIGEREEYTT